MSEGVCVSGCVYERGCEGVGGWVKEGVSEVSERVTR